MNPLPVPAIGRHCAFASLWAILSLTSACGDDLDSQTMPTTGLSDPSSGATSSTGGPEETDTATAPSPKTPRGECDLSQRVGGFVLELESDQFSISGQVFNAVDPIKAWTMVKQEGECELRRRENPVCVPPCMSGLRCNLDAQCVPAPMAQDLGEIRVWGLKKFVKMMPRGTSSHYFDTQLPSPAYDDDAAIGLVGTSLAWPLELWVKGVAAFVLETKAVKIARGQPLVLRWVPDHQGAQVRVRLNVDQHGTSPLFLRCKTSDSGELRIPATLVDALLDAGASGFPSLRVQRQSGDSVTSPQGCVDFVVSQGASVELGGYDLDRARRDL